MFKFSTSVYIYFDIPFVQGVKESEEYCLYWDLDVKMWYTKIWICESSLDSFPEDLSREINDSYYSDVITKWEINNIYIDCNDFCKKYVFNAHKLVLTYCNLLKDRTYVKMTKEIQKLNNLQVKTRCILRESKEKLKIISGLKL